MWSRSSLQEPRGTETKGGLGIHHALDEVEPLGHELIAVVHDEHAASSQVRWKQPGSPGCEYHNRCLGARTHVELDVVALLLGLEEVEGSTAGHEEQGPELKLTSN